MQTANDLQLFSNEEIGQLRTILIDGNPWFVAKDVCDILQLSNSRKAVSRLDNDEKNTVTISDGIGNPTKSIINESGLYSLVLTSRKPEAKRFKKWVTAEVLPSIRKTGSYSSEHEPLSLEELTLQQSKILWEHKKKQERLEEQQRILEARINNFDQLKTEDKRQKLNAMVRKYAHGKGVQYPTAWRDFVRYYNNAYHTNLTRRKRSYDPGISTPKYLEVIRGLDDGIRVADKMLQGVAFETVV